MKITSLELRNFKAVGDEPQTIRFAPITLLFGPNSAGKSTVLQALVYLREIFLHRNLNPDFTELGGDWLDLGGFESLINGHDTSKQIVLSLTAEDEQLGITEFWDPRDDDALQSWEGGSILGYVEGIWSVKIRLTLSFSERSGMPYCSKFEIDVNNEIITQLETDADGQNVSISKINFDHALLNLEPNAQEELGTSFIDVFNDVVDSNKIAFSSNKVLSQLSEERPFIRYRLSELEELVVDLKIGAVDTTAQSGFVDLPYGTREVLKKIQEELGFRQQRSAFEFKLKVDELLDLLSGVNERPDELRILLDGMDDALPYGLTRLAIFDQIWLEEQNEGFNKQKFIEMFLNSIILGAFRSAKKVLSDLNYIGPLRQLPVRQFAPRKSPAKSRWSSGLAAWESLHDAKEQSIEDLNVWLGDTRLNTGYEVQVKRFREVETSNPLIAYLEQQANADQQALIADLVKDLPIKTKVTLKESASGLEVMPQDVGVGISQLLPVVIATMQNSPGVLAVEQPELHIHPAIQVELADLFAAYANTAPDKVFLLETHSEHLLLRLQKRIRDSAESMSNVSETGGTRLIAEQVGIVYIESDQYGLKATNIEMDENGEFTTRWPKGFFVERRKELM